MKRILFCIGTHGNELASLRLFFEYPYGRNDWCEWEIIVVNPDAVFLNQRYVFHDMNRKTYPGTPEQIRKEQVKTRIQRGNYDVLYDIHTSNGIKPAHWPDCIFVNEITDITREAVSYVNARYVIWDHDPRFNQNFITSRHPGGITLEYQKTSNCQYDWRRIHSDFERIISSKKTCSDKIYYKAGIPVSQLMRDDHNLAFEDFKPLTIRQKKSLRLPAHEEYVPVFVKGKELDPTTYCYLNKRFRIDAKRNESTAIQEIR